MDAQIGELIRASCGGRDPFEGVSRPYRKPYDLDRELETVQSIGRHRSARFVIDPDNEFLYRNFLMWLWNDPRMMCQTPDGRQARGRLSAGIYITGNTGSGKSWAMEIMGVYARIVSQPVVIRYRRALTWTCLRTDTAVQHYSRTGDMESLNAMDIVCYQDLGAEPAESMYMGNRVNVMRSVLETRGDMTGKITLVTSNLPLAGQQTYDRYGDRVVSRLQEMCNYFELVGKDRRTYGQV